MSASASVTFTINSAAATAVALNPLVNFSTTASPVAPGTALYSITVTPPTWVGTYTLSGTNASELSVSGNDVVVGSNPLPGGTGSFTVTANP